MEIVIHCALFFHFNNIHYPYRLLCAIDGTWQVICLFFFIFYCSSSIYFSRFTFFLSDTIIMITTWNENEPSEFEYIYILCLYLYLNLEWFFVFILQSLACSQSWRLLSIQLGWGSKVKNLHEWYDVLKVQTFSIAN